VTAAYSRTAGETVAGGPYTISATLSPAGALGNYAITYNTASFTITTKTASVTPAAASKTYGADDPALAGTLSGFLAADVVTATSSRTAGETVAGSPYTISATLSPAGVLGNYNHHLQHGELHDHQGDGLGDAEHGEQDLRRRRPEPADDGTLSGFLAADSVTAAYSRTAGGTVAGSPYTISATLSPAGVLALRHHLQHGELHDHQGDGLGDAEHGEQDLRRRRPSPLTTGTLRRLPGRRQRDGGLQPHRWRDGGRQPVHDQRDAEPGGGAGQLRHHLQHGQLHDHHKDRFGDAAAAKQDLRRRRPALTGTLSGFRPPTA